MDGLVYNASVFRCSVVYVIEKRWNLKEIAKGELKKYANSQVSKMGDK